MSINTILPRITSDNRPAVFLLNTLDDKGSIQVWYADEDEVVASDLQKYKATNSPNDQDISKITDLYVKKFGYGEGLSVRKKLMRHQPPARLTLNNGEHAKKIVTQEVTEKQEKDEFKPQAAPAKGPLKVKMPDGTVIPADVFVEKIVVALTNALRETLTNKW